MEYSDSFGHLDSYFVVSCIRSRIEVISPNLPCSNIDHLKHVCPGLRRFELDYLGAPRTIQWLFYPILCVIYYLVLDSLGKLDNINSLLF